MQWDTVEHGAVTLADGMFVDGADRLIASAHAVYRALCDGRWHVSTFPENNLPAHNVGAPAKYHWWEKVGLWFRLGELHREDGPAAPAPSFAKWWLQGRIHCIEGPAWHDMWYLEGRRVKTRSWQRRARRLRWLLPQHK